MDEEFDEDEAAGEELLEDAPLQIRVERTGDLDVKYDGAPLPVGSIDIDAVSLSRLERQPGRVRRG
jgi:hypothetical protein